MRSAQRRGLQTSRALFAYVVASLALSSALGCYTSFQPGESSGGTPCAEPTGYDAPRCEGPGRCVDVLFVMDNRETMLEEQVALFTEVPRMVQVLTTGDRDGDGVPDVPPVTDLHFGAVTSDLGSGGTFVDGCLSPDSGDDGIVGRGRTGRLSDVCGLTIPPFLAYSPEVVLDDFTLDAACAVTVGIFGCPYAQPLDAALKALSESPAPVHFYRDTCAHADGDNAGFLREDSILVVIFYTDHDDCSVADPAFFSERAATATDDPGLVCNGAASSLHPLARYVGGFARLRGDSADLAFTIVAGIPSDLATSGGEPVTDGTYLRILDDPRMQVRPDPRDPTRLAPSCNVAGRGMSFPARRLIEVGRELDARGAMVDVGSICRVDFTPTLDHVLSRL